jgi:Cu(I)/Ag(I) efflux system membrane protein CusA/SilA
MWFCGGDQGKKKIRALVCADFRVQSGLLIITVSFLPIFSLEAQEGRLFSPLAFTKTFSMAAAAVA